MLIFQLLQKADEVDNDYLARTPFPIDAKWSKVESRKFKEHFVLKMKNKWNANKFTLSSI